MAWVIEHLLLSPTSFYGGPLRGWVTDISQAVEYSSAAAAQTVVNYYRMYAIANTSPPMQIYGAPVFNVDLYGAVGDGTTNDLAAINTAIVDANAAGGGTVMFTPGKVYAVDGSVEVLDNIYISGYGAILKQINTTGQFTRLLHVVARENVVIEGLALDGNQSTYIGLATEQRHGYFIIDSDRVVLRDVYSYNHRGDGVYVGASDTVHHSTNVYGFNIWCDSNYRQGMSITDLRHGRFYEFRGTNTVGTAPQCGIDLEPNEAGSVVEDVKFFGGEVSGNAGAGVQGLCFETPTAEQENISIVGMKIYDNGGSGAAIVRCKDFSLIDCDVLNNVSIGVVIEGKSANIKVIGGRIRLNGQQGVFALADGVTDTCAGLKLIGVVVQDNGSVLQNTKDGVRIDWSGGAVNGCSDVVISDCTICNITTLNQQYGISTTVNVRRLRLTGTELNGNSSGEVVLLDDSATRTVLGCPGVADWFGSLMLTGSLGIGGSSNATIPGSVVKKIPIKDNDGNSLGFIPVYDAIT